MAVGIEGGIRGDLFDDLFRRQSGSRFLGHNGDPFFVQEQGGSRLASHVRWRPFSDAHLVEFHFQKSAQQVQYVIVIHDLDSGTRVFAEAELASDGVEPQADFADEPE